MRLDQQSAVILSFPRMAGAKTDAPAGQARLDRGRLTNLAFMLVVLALAGLWLVFPPAQLTATSAAPQAMLARDLPAKNPLR
jgi:hypothetical protein